jgi:mannose-6-phosphate isomerase
MNSGFSAEQNSAARDFVGYVMSDMARLWANAGWNSLGQHGHERLQADLQPSRLGYRRGMAVGRQLFFFSQAWRVTGETLFAERAHACYADLTERFWDSQHGGWFFSLGDDGQPAEATKDLYGHAFVMFGLAHYASIFGRREALDWAGRTNELVKTRLWLPQGWGAQAATREWSLKDAALEQNPHMHLLEAYLSLHAASGDPAWLAEAQRMVAVYTERLRSFDGAKVLEHFDARGEPLPDKGRLIQPGHLYEWYWLLNEYADSAGLVLYSTSSAPLIAWADRYGVDDRYGGIYFQVDADGAIVVDRKRIWPVTECIKAYATLARHTGNPSAYDRLSEWIAFITKTYFTAAGGWHEFVRRDLTPDSDYMPSSTPYHAAMAALEVERLLGGPGAFKLQRLQSNRDSAAANSKNSREALFL